MLRSSIAHVHVHSIHSPLVKDDLDGHARVGARQHGGKGLLAARRLLDAVQVARGVHVVQFVGHKALRSTHTWTRSGHMKTVCRRASACTASLLRCCWSRPRVWARWAGCPRACRPRLLPRLLHHQPLPCCPRAGTRAPGWGPWGGSAGAHSSAGAHHSLTPLDHVRSRWGRRALVPPWCASALPLPCFLPRLRCSPGARAGSAQSRGAATGTGRGRCSCSWASARWPCWPAAARARRCRSGRRCGRWRRRRGRRRAAFLLGGRGLEGLWAGARSGRGCTLEGCRGRRAPQLLLSKQVGAQCWQVGAAAAAASRCLLLRSIAVGERAPKKMDRSPSS